MSVRCPSCGVAVSLAEQIRERLRVPATPTELSSLFGKSRGWIRSTLYELEKSGKARKLERGVLRQGKRGRILEPLWEAA